ncbi:FMN-binding protein [Cellulomonas cellasea]|uniref:FMN-binding protein n=1 Tax=Cellulomonas cellasea TaxID=43670 RepID=UPI0025A4C2BD|nr:FMN-binding protein [Cellulomonas cellasea]MDM8086382.1 FMN-binding protein [Cellulomonas cellasea]
MRRILFAACGTAVGLILLFSWPTSWNRPVDGAEGRPLADPSPEAVDPGGPADPSDDEGAGGVYTGVAVPNGHGDVQVQITVADGAVVEAQAVQYPTSDPRARQVNTRAIPILDEEAVGATSGDIDMVSGATLTSNAYRESLQDALDQAGL